MRVVRNTFRLQYTNFILTNDSELEKEEKIKCYFSLLFLFDLAKSDKGELLNK